MVHMYVRVVTHLEKFQVNQLPSLLLVSNLLLQFFCGSKVLYLS